MNYGNVVCTILFPYLSIEIMTKWVTTVDIKKPSLDCCISAPVGTHKTLFLESHEVAFSRSMTDKSKA
ncbi:hypothetical protein LOK49_LG06G01347 [Camellia lanceoleosa]|uniref:Uncharacterized protein n=1 Tax=Camellia lanceoleosa TaxID=1840588 RepID=A0ACC0HAF1_9ERIC|nr:hypothetical protein LOK49_LG06G01347 [Camellia lanceoleosa]